MRDTLVYRISRHLYAHGFNRSDAGVSAAALIAAWFEDRKQGDPIRLFHDAAKRLSLRDEHDALTTAANWMSDPGFSTREWDAVSSALAELRHSPAVSIDWTSELEASAGEHRFGPGIGPTMPIAQALNRTLAIPLSESCACLFSDSTSLAWVMSSNREVTLFTGQRELGTIAALFARVARRRLKVDRRNPIDGSFMPAPEIIEFPERRPPVDSFDHIITMPPFGRRIEEGPDKGLPFEAFQIGRLAPLAKRTFSTIITDGYLFRENRHESTRRREMIKTYKTTVMSLPQGMFMPSSGVSASLVRLETGLADGLVRVVDGRTMEKSSSGRVQEQLIVRQLEEFQGLHTQNNRRTVVISPDELEASNFSLLPERYIRSEGLMQIEETLRHREVFALDQIATIERSKAPTPLRNETEEAAVAAIEIAPADIVDGFVNSAKRSAKFSSDQASIVEKVVVESGDLVISIKGNVGVVGLVGLGADLAKVMDTPWIISQSLAIVRLKPDAPVTSPEVLNAILTAPWVREKLESLSGGSTVRTLPISALRSLLIPIPTVEETALALQALRDTQELREQLEKLKSNIDKTRTALWHRIWHVEANSETNETH